MGELGAGSGKLEAGSCARSWMNDELRAATVSCYAQLGDALAAA